MVREKEYKESKTKLALHYESRLTEDAKKHKKTLQLKYLMIRTLEKEKKFII